MAYNWSYYYHLSASGGESGTVNVLTFKENVEIRRVQIFFPIGDYGELRVVVKRGNLRVAPKRGYVAGDGNVFVFEVSAEVRKGHSLSIEYVNENETETREAYFLFEGVRRD